MYYSRKQKKKQHILIWSINYVLFVMMIFLKAYGDAMIANERTIQIFSIIGLDNINNLKYIFLVLATIINLPQIAKNGILNNSFSKDLKNFILLMFLWILISIITLFNVTTSLNYSIKYWVFIMVPFVYSYCTINIINLEMVEKYFKTALAICFGCYLVFEIGIAMFTASNMALISFLDSASPFESAYAAGSSIGMCAYFAYNRKGNMPWLIASMVFCFFTFKRLSVIMMFLYFITPIIFDKNRIVKKRWVIFRGVLVVAIAIFESIAFHPNNYNTFNQVCNNIFGIDVDKIFMGRVRLYSVLVNSGYRTAGLGTTLDKMYALIGKGSGIELELVQLLLEITIIGVIAFVIYCYKLARGNLYCLIIIDFMLFNMLTSSSLGSPFAWIFTYLTIWSIHKKNLIRQNIGVDNEKIYNNNSNL